MSVWNFLTVVYRFLMLQRLFCEAGPGLDALSLLPQDDKAQYVQMREVFQNEQEHAMHERHQSHFREQIERIRRWVDARIVHRQVRGLIAGLISCGAYICVNTRQLQKLMGRCKSSINNGFQQLGYCSVKSKSRASQCLLTTLPCLVKDQRLSRQWTVRYCARRERRKQISEVPMPIIERPLSVPIEHCVFDEVEFEVPRLSDDVCGFDCSEECAPPGPLDLGEPDIALATNDMVW